MVLIEIIADYLGCHRRVVVPQLGTFVVKMPDGGVVFSELLRRDDGVLRGLLRERSGMSELEAAGAIDRFVFEVRHALEREGVYPMEGFGRMLLAANGTIEFRYEPAAKPAAAATAMPSASTEAQTEPERKQEPERTAPAEPRVSPSRLRVPEPCVRGLQYGKPLKTTEGYTYLGAAPRRGPDKFVLIAIAVALLAVGVIVYGYLRRAKIERLEREYMEQLVLPEGEGAELPVADEAE